MNALDCLLSWNIQLASMLGVLNGGPASPSLQKVQQYLDILKENEHFAEAFGIKVEEPVCAFI